MSSAGSAIVKHVVIDARSLRQQRDGLASYISEIVPRIASAGADLQLTVLADPSMREFWASATPESRIVPSDCRPMWPGQHWRIPLLLRRLRPDLYFYPVHDPPVLAPHPFIFVIQDVVSHQIRPYHERMDGPKVAYTRAVTAAGLRRASKVLASSQATKTAVADVFGDRHVAKIRVVPLGTTASRAPMDYRLEAPCLLYVGTDRPQKNLERLMSGYAEAQRRREGGLPDLVLIGEMSHRADLREQAARAGLGDRVVFRGHVSDVELEAMYERALALVFPSVVEGFGLPILEAMSRSVPVVTSNQSACAEVAGDAALLVDPYSVESIADGLLEITDDAALRHDLAKRGDRRVLSFTWDRCAAGTLEVMRESLQGTDGI